MDECHQETTPEKNVTPETSTWYAVFNHHKYQSEHTRRRSRSSIPYDPLHMRHNIHWQKPLRWQLPSFSPRSPEHETFHARRKRVTSLESPTERIGWHAINFLKGSANETHAVYQRNGFHKILNILLDTCVDYSRNYRAPKRTYQWKTNVLML